MAGKGQLVFRLFANADDACLNASELEKLHRSKGLRSRNESSRSGLRWHQRLDF
jgi:predicted DNA-binding WGR domain protein